MPAGGDGGDVLPFVKAIVNGDRFDLKIYDKMTRILRKQTGSSDPFIVALLKFLGELRTGSEQGAEEDDLFDEAPDEFLDEIMATLMDDPVGLPSGHTMDRKNIERVILESGNNPFTREPLKLEDLVRNARARIGILLPPRCDSCASAQSESDGGAAE